MRQSEALKLRRERERYEHEMLEIRQLQARNRKRSQSKPKQGKRQSRKRVKNVRPSNMTFTSDLELVTDDSPVASLFAERLTYRDASRDTSHKARRERNEDAIGSTIRTPRSRTIGGWTYNAGGKRSTRPA